MSKKRLRSISQAFGETGASLALGLRDAIRPRLLLLSLLVWLIAFVSWTTAFIVWWEPIRTSAGSASLLFVLGALLFSPQLFTFGAAAGTTMAGIVHAVPGLLAAGFVYVVLQYLLIVLLYAGAMLLTTRVLLELFLMKTLQRQALQKYPQLPGGFTGSLRAALRNLAGQWLLLVVFGAIFLMIPVLNGILLFALFCYLNVRSLVNNALDGIASDAERRAVIRENRLAMLLLGVVLMLVMVTPVLALIGPALTGSSVCHLCMRSLARLRDGPRESTAENAAPQPA